MDALSEALKTVRMTGAIFFIAECAAPWGFRVPHLREAAQVPAPGTERLVSYHLVTEGHAVARFAGLDDISIAAGDLLLALLHNKPFHHWTLPELASAAGASRSVVTERFTRLLGEPPLKYVARWRLQLAARTLQTSRKTILQIGL